MKRKIYLKRLQRRYNVAIHRSYFAIIPASVRYDNRLIPSAKLLYGEITALSNERGYCWASNDYFAQLYGVSKTTIKSWLKSLEDNGHINRIVKYKNGSKEIENRWISIITPRQENLPTPAGNLTDPRQENLPTPRQEICPDNNTSINNTINSTKEYIGDLPTSKKSKSKPVRHKYGEYKNVLLSDDQLEKLKSEFPNDWEQRIDRVSEYCESTGKTYKNYLATIRNWAKKDKTQPNQPIRKKQPYVRQEKLPEWANEPVNYSRNKPKVTEEDRRRFLNVSGREEGF
ncbi:helix-turn-helix domain-containing protein [Enterococcus casseliflavus]|nr:helix-turn-helix domain-containing protein [Enterococcus casseliflavus]MBX9127730.1 helix-turn-helix domain-containing protein [Enterococcus casseliflavus]